MTYRNAARQKHFQTRTGSSSQTGYGNAWAHGGDPIEILPSVKEQYEGYKIKAREARSLIERTAGKEREAARAQLAEALRNIGSMRQLLQEGSRFAFETIVTRVASYRLPKDRFLAIVEEAREIWRSEGYADFVPPPTKKTRKLAVRRETKRAMSAADAHFG